MEREEVIDVLNGMCERCLIKGVITTLDEAKTLYNVFDRFYNNNYTNDEEYSGDILYLYNLAVKLHENGYTSLEESYSIYSAILAADNINFVETDVNADVEHISEEKIVNVEPVVIEKEKDVEVEPIKVKRSKPSRSKKVKAEDVGVIDISNISL